MLFVLFVIFVLIVCFCTTEYCSTYANLKFFSLVKFDLLFLIFGIPILHCCLWWTLHFDETCNAFTFDPFQYWLPATIGNAGNIWTCLFFIFSTCGDARFTLQHAKLSQTERFWHIHVHSCFKSRHAASVVKQQKHIYYNSIFWLLNGVQPEDGSVIFGLNRSMHTESSAYLCTIVLINTEERLSSCIHNFLYTCLGT